MQSWPIRQQFPRSPLQIPFRHRVLASPVGCTGLGWTRNVSEGGACIEVAETLPPAAPLRLHLQTDRGTIELEAVVVWAGRPTGDRGSVRHGLLFTRIASDQRQLLRALLQAKAKMRQNGARISTDLPVTYLAPQQAGPARCGRMENVSWGGSLLILSELLPPGTRLKISWQMAGEQLAFEGMVAWAEPQEEQTAVRHGLRFIRSTDSAFPESLS